MQMEWKQHCLTITNEKHRSSDELFQALSISKKTRYQYYIESKVLLNHQIIKQNASLAQGDVLEVHCIYEQDGDEIHPYFVALDIVYEDELFFIVHKPAHMLVHSDGVSQEKTLYDIVKAYYLTHHIPCPVRAIHRLDKETSGAVIFCKIPLLQPLLDQMLKEKKIERIYCAICVGNIKKDFLQINAPIGRDRHHGNKMRISSSGKEAKTDVRVIQRYKQYTQVECKLYQGRTHQIRVHLASIGHPILHDPLYGQKDATISRLALHAKQVILFHPLLQKKLFVECDFPEDIKKLLL